MIRPLVSRDTFVPTKIVLKVGFLERNFERDHLAEKSYWTKISQKINTLWFGALSSSTGFFSCS
jgi:hypothetical protein